MDFEPVGLEDPLPIRAALDRDGFVVVSNVGSRADLLDLATAFGTPVPSGLGMPRSLLEPDQSVYEVRVRNQGGGETDVHGHLVYSTSAAAFPFHTDAFNAADPPDVVLLHRTDRSADWTTSYVCDCRVATRHLGSEAIATLRSPIYPSARGLVPVLTYDDDGALHKVQFNRVEIDRWSLRSGIGLTRAAESALKEMERVVAAFGSGGVLLNGQCLVLRNRTTVHGRPAMSPSSGRVLDRVWVRKAASA